MDACADRLRDGELLGSSCSSSAASASPAVVSSRTVDVIGLITTVSLIEVRGSAGRSPSTPSYFAAFSASLPLRAARAAFSVRAWVRMNFSVSSRAWSSGRWFCGDFMR